MKGTVDTVGLDFKLPRRGLFFRRSSLRKSVASYAPSGRPAACLRVRANSGSAPASSLAGGLPLFELFKPSRRSSSAIRAFIGRQFFETRSAAGNPTQPRHVPPSRPPAPAGTDAASNRPWLSLPITLPGRSNAQSRLLRTAAHPHGSLTRADAPLIDAENLFRQTGTTPAPGHDGQECGRKHNEKKGGKFYKLR
jgi:hypothetical protein